MTKAGTNTGRDKDWVGLEMEAAIWAPFGCFGHLRHVLDTPIPGFTIHVTGLCQEWCIRCFELQIDVYAKRILQLGHLVISTPAWVNDTFHDLPNSSITSFNGPGWVVL